MDWPLRLQHIRYLDMIYLANLAKIAKGEVEPNDRQFNRGTE